MRGIWLEEDYQRSYPYGSLASDVIGFVVGTNEGAIGIESAYNDILNGTNGREYGYFNDDASIERTVKAAKNGNTVVSTIDLTLQSMVEQCIREFNEAHAGEARPGQLGSKNTAVMIMNPNTGAILAEASYPDFDLNNPRDLSILYSEEQWKAMSEEEQLNAMNDLWRNFCVSDTFEPGSTVKPMTVAAGLESGKLKPEDGFECDGNEVIGGRPINCVNTSGHGWQTMEQVLMNSCNDALMQMSYRIGADIFTRYQQIFGFGQRTNIDLPGEARTASLIYQRENMTPIDLATNSFGQNFNTTMIQLASAYCSLVNGGYFYQPRIVKKITDENGNTIEEFSPTLLRQTVCKETSDLLKQYMYATVTGGTGSTAKVDGYSMGGKTGTAQKIGEDGQRDKNNYLVSFIGFAPVEDPQLVIYCVVDEPNVMEQFHSTYAQDIVREILEEVLPYLNVYRDEETTGVHEGWDIKGQESGEPATTDLVNGVENPSLPVEDGLTDIPNTMGVPSGEPGGTAPEGAGDAEGGAAGGSGGADP